MKKYDVLVYIGRFQPVHNAHIEIIRRACAMADRLVIIAGSANQPRTYKNPWNNQEREFMLRTAIAQEVNTQGCEIYIEHNPDTVYNDQAWAIRVQALVGRHEPAGASVGIIGHDKDESTFYLKMFPQWTREEVPLIEPLNATDVRDLFFKWNFNSAFIKYVLPAAVHDFLIEFRESEAFAQVVREREFIENYQKQYAGLPYKPIFVTTDAVVIQSGHVLMIRRRSEPGRGLWALPGGFVNADTDRSVQAACIRELREETGIRVPAPVLVGNIKDNRVFDAVGRSARGRTITHAFKILLPDGELPKVRGQDDADRALWVPVSDVKSEECFEDHYEIIQWAIGG